MICIPRKGGYTPKQMLAYRYSERIKLLADATPLMLIEYDDILLELLTEYEKLLRVRVKK